MKRIYSAVFSVSFAVLMFEVSLTRLFSIHLSYHFAFLILSIAMLGTGAAGTVLTMRNQGKSADKDSRDLHAIQEQSSFTLYAFLAASSLIFSLLVIKHISFDPIQLQWDKKQLLNLFLFCLALSMPFFFAGLLIAEAFSIHSEKSGLIYGSDLFGAGLGAVASFIILNFRAPETAVATALLFCLLGAFLSGGPRSKLTAAICALCFVMTFNYYQNFFRVPMSPYKQLSQYVRFPGAEHIRTYYSPYAQVDTFRSPAVRYAPGLSLNYLEPLPDQIGLAADGNAISVITDARDRSGLLFLQSLPSSVVYETADIKDVLVLDPLGGMPVLAAQYFGAETVHKVESNPVIIDVLNDDYNDYSGSLFKTHTWSGLGRNFLDRLSTGRVPSVSDHRYDLIDISLTGVSVSGVFGIAEDYRYTVEAFRKYLSHLKAEGYISISLYLMPPPRSEFRMLATLLEALEKTGMEDPSGNVAAVRSWDSITIIFKNAPLTKDNIRRIREFCQRNRFDTVYYPGIESPEANRYIRMSDNFLHESFVRMLDAKSRSSFISDYAFDIRPVYDDRPFFTYHLRLKNIREIYDAMGRNWLYFMDEGYLFFFIFLISCMFGTAIIFLPLAARHGRKYTGGQKATASVRSKVFGYFSALGLGFMFSEIAVLHKSILVIENPSYTFAVVVASILVSSGAGSMMSSRYDILRSPKMLLLPALILCLYSLAFHYLIAFVPAHYPAAGIATVSLLTLPLGFFMGIPFPLGMRLLGEKSPDLIPWAWAVNASLSVLAPVLAVMLALVTGFSHVLAAAALSYLLAYFLVKKLLLC